MAASENGTPPNSHVNVERDGKPLDKAICFFLCSKLLEVDIISEIYMFHGEIQVSTGVTYDMFDV